MRCASKEQGYKDYKKLDTENIPYREVTSNQKLPATYTVECIGLQYVMHKNPIAIMFSLMSSK